ncbi:4516_t:CDS:2, partial [Ambispora gerdemannii]
EPSPETDYETGLLELFLSLAQTNKPSRIERYLSMGQCRNSPSKSSNQLSLVLYYYF